MKDIISVARVQSLHPKISNEVKEIIEEIESKNNFAIRIVQAYRDIKYQDQLFCQPFDGVDNDKDGKIDEADEKVTNSRGGQSFHNYRLAFDFAIMYDKDNNGTYEILSWDILKDYDKDGQADWQEVVKAFKTKGYEWGGDWKRTKDNPHIQKTFGHTWQELFSLFKQNKFISNTTYLNI